MSFNDKKTVKKEEGGFARSLPEVKQLIEETAKQLDKVPEDWLVKQTKLQDQLEQLPTARQAIRIKKDVIRELEELRKMIAERRSGGEKRKYVSEANRYLSSMRGMKDDSAFGEVKNSLITLSNSQLHKRYRKRSDLHRAIRMASRVTLNEMQILRRRLFSSTTMWMKPPQTRMTHLNLMENLQIPLTKPPLHWMQQRSST